MKQSYRKIKSYQWILQVHAEAQVEEGKDYVLQSVEAHNNSLPF